MPLGANVDIVAFTTEHVRKLTGLSTRQIRYWDDTGFFSPALVDGAGGRAFARIYGFRDVVGLRTIAILRKDHGLPLQELRKVGEWLRAKHDSPWSSLRFALSGRKVAYFDTVASAYVEARGSGQTLIEVTLEPIAAAMSKAAERLKERGPEELGRIVRNRYVVHNAWVIAGTRIPIAAIVSLHNAGYDADQIIKEYPRLTRADVAAALSYKPDRRRAA